jgi:DNA-binding NtrC family response regulator
MPPANLSLSDKCILLADDDRALRHTFVPALEQAGLHVEMCLNGIELQRMLSERAADFDAVITDLWNMGETTFLIGMFPG